VRTTRNITPSRRRFATAANESWAMANPPA
jgi:hypothetical protein